MQAAANVDVLVVEDDALCREAICTLLEIEGFRVATAASGESALALLVGVDAGGGGELAPSVILLDLVMPRMSGPALLEALRKSAAAAAIPVVLVSGRADVERLSRELGVQGFLKKPPDADAIVAVVRRLLGAGPLLA